MTIVKPSEAGKPARRTAKPQANRLVIGGIPRASLLPPEVEADARARGLRRNLIAGVILAAIVVGLGYAGASVVAVTAQLSLDAANNRTTTIIQGQNKYLEVRQITSMLATTEVARRVGASTEVDWNQFLATIGGSLPAGTTITNFSADFETPTANYTSPTAPLQGDRIGQLTFTSTTASLPDVELWLNSLKQLDGYVDATPGSVVLDETTKLYTVTIVMHVNGAILANRFIDDAPTDGN